MKAMKLSKPQLVDLCNFFDVDRTVDKGEPSLDKEGVINRLLDFLGEPDEGLTRTYNGRSATGNAATIKGRKKKATGKNTKKEIQKAVEAEVVSSDHTSTDEEVESGTSMDKEVENEKVEDGKGEKGETIVAAKKKGLREAEQNGNAKGAHKLPSEKDLRKWVKAYVACFNLNKATINHAIETASEKFGVNVSSKKAILKTLLTEEIRKQIHVD